MNLLCLSMLGLMVAGAALPQTCSVSDIRGTYLFQSSGVSSTAGSSTQVPARVLGLVQFDGSGQATGRMTLTMGGAIGGTTSGYDFSDFAITVNPDCTGQVQYQLKGEGAAVLGPDKLELLVLDEGARIWTQVAQSSDRTVLMTSEFQRVRRGSRTCAQSMLRGSYLFRADGVIDQRAMNSRAAPGFVPAFGIGNLVIDPDSDTLTGGSSNVWGGTNLHTVLKNGTMRVNGDCTGTFEYQLQVTESGANMTGTAPLILIDNGERIFVLLTSLPAIYVYERVSIP